MTTPEFKSLAPQTTQRLFGADTAELDGLRDLFLLTRRPRDLRVGRNCAAEGAVETCGCDRRLVLLVPLGEVLELVQFWALAASHGADHGVRQTGPRQREGADLPPRGQHLSPDFWVLD